MKWKPKTWIFHFGVAISVMVLGLSGIIAHGMYSIRALPPEILIPIGFSGCTVLPYDKDPKRTITGRDFQEIKDAMVQNCFMIGLYGGGGMVAYSKTNVTVGFYRRATMLSISCIKTNDAWTVTDVTKETLSYDISKGYFGRILDGMSAVFP